MVDRARAEPPPPPVIWRGGTHLVATPIWCDARRARDVCFVSAAHAVDASRHGQLIATAPTLALLARSSRRQQPISHLSVPYGQPFTLGTVRLELIQSGHSIGSASLAVDINGTQVLYGGVVNPHGGGLGGVADLRPCDAVVVATSYGESRFTFPPVAEVQSEVIAFAQRILAAGGTPVLLVTTPSKGLDVAERLAAAGVELCADRPIHHAAQRLRRIGVSLPPIRRWNRRTGQWALLWTTDRRAPLEEVKLPPASEIALVSGCAVDAAEVSAAGAARGYPWSSQADHSELLAYLDGTGAARLFLIGRGAEPLAAELDRPGRPARVLGPPLQMNLF